MPQATATKTVSISYNSANETWTFMDGNTAIPNGDLTAAKSATTTFTFVPASGQTWTFVDFTIGLKVASSTNGTTYILGGSQDEFDLSVASNQAILTDKNSTTGDITYEYAFSVNLGGRIIVCDPKIYNKGN